MNNDKDRLARVLLSTVGEPGDPRLLRLVDELGAEAVVGALGNDEWSLGTETLLMRIKSVNPEQRLESAAAQGIRFVIPGDDEWPGGLGDLDGHTRSERGGVPIGLWVKGPGHLRKWTEDYTAAVAIIGSRSATTYGTSVASDIAAGVAKHVPVISGGAFGIDNAAHRGALAVEGRTIMVLANGVDRMWPTAHQQLASYIGEVGLLVSEAPPGAAPTRIRFLARNRIIAALATGTVVVEAAIRSGALNAAHWAATLDRRLMGVPGPVTSAPSAGVHQLLRDGVSLVTGPEDVLEVLGVRAEAGA